MAYNLFKITASIIFLHYYLSFSFVYLRISRFDPVLNAQANQSLFLCAFGVTVFIREAMKCICLSEGETEKLNCLYSFFIRHRNKYFSPFLPFTGPFVFSNTWATLLTHLCSYHLLPCTLFLIAISQSSVIMHNEQRITSLI